ncbi:MAG: alpha-galactosidase [Clostridia bacterium]|nr:alpha-galactosidase [Clostridia bacterium]
MTKTFLINGIAYSVQSAREPVSLNLEPAQSENGIEEITLSCDFGENGPTQGIAVSWSEPMKGILSVWTPTIRRNRAVMQWFAPTTTESNFASGAPVLAVVENGETNHCTVALSDAVLPARLSFFVNDFEQMERIAYRTELLKDARVLSSYTVRLRIDRRPVPLAMAIAEAVMWQRAFYPRRLPITRASEAPLYSSWYNFHQHPNAQALLAELAVAAKIGFENVIIDDGWQYEGNGTGDYYDCGDWAVAPGKFPDFAGFVRQVHAMGLKLMLWFPVPFAGLNTRAFAEYESRCLYVDRGLLRAGILDPRYPEVRSHITDTLASFMREYDLDGLKLDFIDSFRLKDDSPAFGAGMDCETVDAAVTRLMDETITALTAIRPDCMLEFRQNYVGAAITAYGSMIRVGDCAFDSITNRIGTADLRMLCPDMAVHADMLYWSGSETKENCAVQMINILFSVPQISIELTKASLEQRMVVERFIRYMKENCDVLLHASFEVSGSEAGYAALTARSAGKRITAHYLTDSDVFDGQPCDLFNATSRAGLFVENATPANAEVRIVDCLGRMMSATYLDAGEIKRLPVPVGGMAMIFPQS